MQLKIKEQPLLQISLSLSCQKMRTDKHKEEHLLMNYKKKAEVDNFEDTEDIEYGQRLVEKMKLHGKSCRHLLAVSALH